MGGSTFAVPSAAVPQLVEPPVDLAVVPLGAQHREALGLLGLDRRVDAQRLVGLLVVDR